MAESTQTNSWLGLALEAYEESTTYFDAGVRREIENDMRRFQGIHPVGSKYLSDGYRARSQHFRPKTRAAIRKNEATAAAAFFANEDVISLVPEDQSNKTQAASAAVWNEVLNHRLRKSIPWFQLLIGAYQDTQVTGVCVSYQGWFYDQRRKIDKPVIKLLPVENFRFSPSADWTDPVGSSPYTVELIPMYVKDVVARMTQDDPKTGEPRWKFVDPTKLLAAQNAYTDSTTLLRNAGRADARAQATAIKDFACVWVHRNILEMHGVDYCYYTLGTFDMLTEPVPVEKMYLHSERPYVVGNCVIETHKIYPGGVSRLLGGINTELNDITNLRHDSVKYSMTPVNFVSRNGQVDLRALARRVPGGSILMGDPAKDVVPQQIKDVTQNAYEEQDRLNLDADELVGTFSQASTNSSRRAMDSVEGLKTLTGDASLMSAYQLMTFAQTWAKPVLRQLVKLEQHYETDEAIFALAGKKAGIVERYNIRHIDESLLMQELSVDVNVGVAATTPQIRLQNLLFALKSVREILKDNILTSAGMDREEVIEEIFAKLGYDGAGRFFQWGQDDPRLAQLQQRIQELEDELKQKEDPELTQAKIKKTLAEADKAAADKVRIGTETTFGAMQAAEVIAAVPAVAPIADAIMRAAGYTPPVPTGVDPGFAPGNQGPNNSGAPVAAAAGLSTNEIVNPHSGIGVTPGGAVAPAAGQPALPPGVSHNTNPLTPAKPASPFVGERGGIETMRPDSQGPKQ